MNYTNNELKTILTKMLPETVALNNMGSFIWTSRCDTRQVLDTELLYIVSLVEAGLTDEQWEDYAHALFNLAHPHDDCGSFEGIARAFLSATWQQRTRALAEVLGVTL